MPSCPNPARHQLLDVVFGRRRPRPYALGNRLECTVLDPVEALGRRAVGRDRLRVPARLEPLHEIARGHHLDAARTDVLDRAGIHAGQVRNGALWRVFHREPPAAGEHAVQPGGERLPACVDQLFAWQLVEVVRLDRVHQLPRLPVGRNHVIPASRGHLAAAGEAGQRRGHRVGSVEVVEQPAVETVGCER